VEPAADDHHGPTGTEGFLTDSNISALLVDRVLRGKYHWAKGLQWMRFDGKKWSQTTDYDVIERSRRFATDLVSGVAASGDADKIRKYTRRLSAGAVRAAADLAKGQLLIDGSAFDRHPDLLNVANGVVDLRTGKLGPHDPKLLLTKCAPTEYRPDAQHADWTAALAALPADVADWMQLRLGQAITGHPTPDDMLPVLHGAGANGKTTLMVGVTKALGEHAVSVPERVLLANPSDHPTELMTLRGARLALLEETPEARHLNVKRLKDTVGTPQMSARHCRQDTVTWDTTHSLFVSTNYRPRVEETDHGTWRRLALIAFPYTYRRDGEALRAPMTGMVIPPSGSGSNSASDSTKPSWRGSSKVHGAGMPPGR
jgi:putative DNA primase/helicase